MLLRAWCLSRQVGYGLPNPQPINTFPYSGLCHLHRSQQHAPVSSENPGLNSPLHTRDMAQLLTEIEAQLKKKSSFEEGVTRLKDFLQCSFEESGQDAREKAIRLVGRVHTLLRTRYSSLAFWKAGAELFNAAKVCTRQML